MTLNPSFRRYTAQALLELKTTGLQRASPSSTRACGPGEGTSHKKNQSRTHVTNQNGVHCPSPVMTREGYYSRIREKTTRGTKRTRETSEGETSPRGPLSDLCALIPQTQRVRKRRSRKERDRRRTQTRYGQKTSLCGSRARKRRRSKTERTPGSSGTTDTGGTSPQTTQNTNYWWRRCGTRDRSTDETGESSRSYSRDSWTDISSTDYSSDNSEKENKHKMGRLGRDTRLHKTKKRTQPEDYWGLVAGGVPGRIHLGKTPQTLPIR
nr:ORF3 [Epsilontorquevirus sp.]